MGQRAISITNFQSDFGLGNSGCARQLALFVTDLGWFGVAGRGRVVHDLAFGHSSPDEVRAALDARDDSSETDWEEADWHPALREQLTRYARGERVEFDDLELQLPELTPFQARVVEETRRIPYGKTISYGALALAAGYPRAARAVGSVMAANRFPVLIPCHRVLGAGGKLRGYSAPRGVNLKQILLDMEAVALGADPRELR
jgi:methylated-DNA-[protein]-cysteine S-methyltransferase